MSEMTKLDELRTLLQDAQLLAEQVGAVDLAEQLRDEVIPEVNDEISRPTEKRYLVTSTVVEVTHMPMEEAKAAAMANRLQGRRSEILTASEVRERKLTDGDQMQDLNKLRPWIPL